MNLDTTNEHLSNTILTNSEFIKVKIFEGHNGEVNCCCLSNDYQILVTASDDATLLLWNVAKQCILCKLVGHSGPVNYCVFSPDNKIIASASHDCTVRLWRTSTAQCTQTLLGHTKSVEHLSFSKDGKMLCSASWDRSIIVWEVQTGTLLHALPGHQDCVKTCCFAHRSDLIGSGSWDGEVRIWRFEENPDDPVQNKHEKWNLRRFQRVPSCSFRVAVMKGHSGNVQAIAFSTAGLMASGSWDRSVCLWNPYRAELLKKLIGHTGWVKAVSFSLDSLQLASSADDDTIRVWNVLSGECTKTYQSQTDVAQHCFFSSSGNLLSSGTAMITS